jgi:hypothetical protein
MFRVLLVKTAVDPDPKDYTVILDTQRRPWHEIAGTVAFDANPEQVESLRAELADFVRRHAPLSPAKA